MPLLLTLPTPLLNDALLPVAKVYALIMRTDYGTRSKVLLAEISYYASEEAYQSSAAPLRLPTLPENLSQQIPVAAVRAAGDIMALLEGLLAQQLLALLPGATIETVP